MLASTLGLFPLNLVLSIHGSVNPYFLAEADKTLESGLILDGVEVCGCSPLVSLIPILLNSNHSVGKERAREVDLSPCPQAFSSGNSSGFYHCEC